jgi:predicted nucleic acid-binding protein
MTASSATRLSRTVVDTNLLVSGLISAMGAPAVLIDALRQDRFLLLSSQPLTAEVDGVLARPSHTSAIYNRQALLPNCAGRSLDSQRRWLYI